MKQLPPNPRILIVRLSAIGDVVRTLPAAARLRRHYPHAHLAWLVEEKAAAVLEDDPVLNELIVFPRREFAQLGRNPLRWLRLWKRWRKFTKKLRAQKFDLVLDFHGILKSGLLARVTRAPIRAGYPRAFVKEWNWLFTNMKVPLPGDGISRYERNLALIRPWVPNEELHPTPLCVPLKDQAKMSLFLAKFGDGHKKKRVILHPGASKPHKRWFADRFARLADELIEKEEAQVILTWGPGEKETAEEVAAGMKNKGEAVLSPELTLKQLAELASQADLFVSADSGPMHIAAAMGTPQIAIFGPTDPQVNDPCGKKSTLVYHKVPCSPCRKGCPQRTCMQQITADEVLTLAHAKLAP